MQPQDTFNHAFDATTVALDRWLDSLADVATVEREHTADFWRARITPLESRSCPVELMLSRAQTYDLELGPESVANQPVTDLDLFLPLLQSIVAGDAVTRSWTAIATGSELTREMLVRLLDGQVWALRRIIAAGGATTSAITFAAEMAGDFTTEAGGATLGIMYSLLGA